MGAGRRRRGDDRAARFARDTRRASAPTSNATASTTGAACRRGSRADPVAAPAAIRRKTIAALAAERGEDPIDTLCGFLADDQGATRVLVTSISEDDVREIVRSPLALVGSDGNCVATYGTVSQGSRTRASTARFRASSATMSASDCCRWNRHPQDDGRDRARAEIEGSRLA